MSSLHHAIHTLVRKAFNHRFLAAKLDDFVRTQLTPGNYVQLYTERFFHEYAKKTPADVGLILNVGANTGYEVDRFLALFPNADFVLFEAGPSQYEMARKRFAKESRVTCRNLCISDRNGKAIFHQTVNKTAGSLLTPTHESESDGMRLESSFEVDCSTLDDYLRDAGRETQEIDLLWADVQGAELMVLRGAEQALQRCRAVYLEVWGGECGYENGCLFDELHDLLKSRGFRIAVHGVEPVSLLGNCLWIKD